MKKKLMIIIMMLIPVVTYGQTCEVEKDTQTIDKRSLVCDAENSTVTTFKTDKEQTVLSNEVCEIKCSEEIVFSVDPVKKVLAGMSFSYPLYTSGERKCTAVYKYTEYEKKIREKVEAYAKATGDEKTTLKNEIVNYYDKRKKCDEFTKEGSTYEEKYAYEGYKVFLDVEITPTEDDSDKDRVEYSFKEMGDYSSIVTTEEINYAACDFNETTMSCKESDTTVTGWTETARIYGKYTMNNAYLEKYTGEVKDAYDDNTCNAGDRYFTSFTEISRPVSNNLTDKGYKLTLTAENLGNNLGLSGDNWILNVDCYYQLNNLMFPQYNSGGNIDENYDEYGGTAFQYRIVDLSNPFPGREPGANWNGKVNIITDTANTITTMERFVITLDRSKISKIRDYNDTHKYDSFNLNDVEKSEFIEANTNIIDRK